MGSLMHASSQPTTPTSSTQATPTTASFEKMPKFSNPNDYYRYISQQNPWFDTKREKINS